MKEKNARNDVMVKKKESDDKQKWLVERKKYVGMVKPSPKKVGQLIYQHWRKWNEPTSNRYIANKYQVDEDDDEAGAKEDDDEAGAKEDNDEAGAKGG